MGRHSARRGGYFYCCAGFHDQESQKSAAIHARLVFHRVTAIKATRCCRKYASFCARNNSKHVEIQAGFSAGRSALQKRSRTPGRFSCAAEKCEHPPGATRRGSANE